MLKPTLFKILKQIRIGKLIFSKKAIGLIALGTFCSGLLMGGFIFLNIKTSSSFYIPLFLILNVLIWLSLGSAIKNELSEKP